MTANNVFEDTVHYLKQYNLEALFEIAHTEFGIKPEPTATKEEIINDCALAEVHNFSI